MHCRLAGRVLQETDLLEVRPRLGKGLARRAVHEPEAPWRVRDAVGGDSAGAGASALRREALLPSRPTPAHQAPRLSDRPGRTRPVVARHFQALEAAAQRGTERGQAEARSMPASPDAGVGAAGAG